MDAADNPALPVTYAEVAAASGRLAGHAHRTPVMTSRTVDERTGARVHFKCENFQRMGAFKFRGAFNALAQLSVEARRRGVLAYSSGNHAQAVALAGRELGARVTIVMPQDAPKGCSTTNTPHRAKNCRRASPPSAASRSSRRSTIRTWWRGRGPRRRS